MIQRIRGSTRNDKTKLILRLGNNAKPQSTAKKRTQMLPGTSTFVPVKLSLPLSASTWKSAALPLF
jgi:hypothetical protein